MWKSAGPLVLGAIAAGVLWWSVMEVRDRSSGALHTPVPAHASSLSYDPLLTIGDADARAVLVVFTDYLCKFCPEAESGSVAELRAKYPAGLLVAYKQFPAVDTRFARYAICGARNGSFAAEHRRLFDRAQAPESSEPGLTGADQACIGAQTTTAAIAADVATGLGLAVTGTPAFFLGRRVPPNQVVDLRRFRWKSFFELDEAVAELLRGEGD